MKTIYKYTLEDRDIQRFAMPQGAVIIALQVQNRLPCMWAEVDTDKPTVSRFFEIFGTGHEIPCDDGVDRVYVGTYQQLGGALVFHVYENTGG